MNLGREGSKILQTYPSELNQYLLRVRLSAYNSVRLTHSTCTGSTRRIFPIPKGVASIYHCSHWHLPFVYLVQDDVSTLLRFFGWVTTTDQ